MPLPGNGDRKLNSVKALGKRRGRPDARKRQRAVALESLTRLEPRMLLSTIVVSTTADSGPGSLRQAITDANANNGFDQIRFSFDGVTGVHRIAPATPLPAISDTVSIDATSLAVGGVPQVEIDGTGAGSGSYGLNLLSGAGSTVAGLSIHGFSFAQVHVDSSAGNSTLRQNFIGLGLSPVGAADSTPGQFGIYVESSADNTIGGYTAADRNVIAGNAVAQVDLGGSAASGNTIVGNLIGLGPDGTTTYGGNAIGIDVEGGSNNQIGYTLETGGANTISGNGIAGVKFNNGSSGSVAWYQAEGNAADSSLARDGTPVNAPTYGPDRNSVGQAFVFDGLTQKVTVPSSPSLLGTYENSGTNLSVEAWVKPGRSGADSTIVSTLGQTFFGRSGYALRQNSDDTFSFIVGRTDSHDDATSTTTLTPGTWYHLLGTYNGSQLDLYVNGVVEGFTTSSRAMNSLEPLTIGAGTQTDAPAYFQGSIDDVAIYDRVLDSTEITSLAAPTADNADIRGVNRLLGNLIGLDATGTVAAPNGIGVYVRNSSNLAIGSDLNAPGFTFSPVISGNAGVGLGLYRTGAGLTANIRVVGATIGLNAAGTVGLGNSGNGIEVSDASDVTIGGAGASANVIARNAGSGISIFGAGARRVLVDSNIIGASGDLSHAWGNSGNGIYLYNAGLGNVLRRNTIVANAGAGIYLYGTSAGTVVQNNRVGGTEAQGASFRNQGSGILLGATTVSPTPNTIGGTAGQGNTIGGNATHGIYVFGNSSVVKANFIGYDPATGLANPNLGVGVYVSGAANTQIGGVRGVEANVITANGQGGVELVGASQTTIQGNYIGVGPDGHTAMGNGFDLAISGPGIAIRSATSDTTIGGGGPLGNVISGNNHAGVAIYDSNVTHTVITTNVIGTDATGAFAVPNAGDGIYMYYGSDIYVYSNLVSGNAGVGIDVQHGSYASISGNTVGLNADGTAALANHGSGIEVSDTPNAVIGAPTGPNVVGGNAGVGINLHGQLSTNAQIVGNIIGANATLSLAFGNLGDGIRAQDFATGATITGNTVVADGGAAIHVYDSATGALITSNRVGGTEAQGATFRNLGDGILIETANNTVGGLAAGNTIGGNAGAGVAVRGGGTVQLNVIAGNYIGFDPDAGAINPNGGDGVEVGGTVNTVGGVVAGMGNVISGNLGNGVYITGENAVIRGNRIGTDAFAAVAAPNTYGILVQGDYAIIGGARDTEANVISGNASGGILIPGPANATTIQGNYIGVGIDGATPIGNGLSLTSPGRGIELRGGPTNTSIGGIGLLGNIISANNLAGIAVNDASTTSTTIQGNFIGTDANGALAVPNIGSGIVLGGGTGITVGGTAGGEGNLISGNTSDGIDVVSGVAPGVVIAGNTIGLNAAGTANLANDHHGIELSGVQGVTIGGSVAAQNVISGNGELGIVLRAGASSNTIDHNIIGANADLSLAFGNGADGIQLSTGVSMNTLSANTVVANNGDGIIVVGSSNILIDNRIGGTEAQGPTFRNLGNGVTVYGPDNRLGGTVAQGNVIGGNAGSGVILVGMQSTGNVVAGNSIGYDPVAAAANPNLFDGIQVGSGASSNTIGGEADFGSSFGQAGNVISGNAGNGVFLDSNAGSTTVLGNRVGTTPDGLSAAANGSFGIVVHGGFSTIGGSTYAAGNVISANPRGGVLIDGGLGDRQPRGRQPDRSRPERGPRRSATVTT